MATGVALFFHPPIHAQSIPQDEVGERLQAEADALAKAGGQLAPDEFEPGVQPDPPAAITEAGEEFVAAWREYQRTLSLKSKKKPSSPAPPAFNITFHAAAYDKLLDALLHTDQPPQPEEFSQFFYLPRVTEGMWCGQDPFAKENQRVVLLSCLRNKRYREAVELLLTPGEFTGLKRTVLPALGFDLRKLTAGAWLSDKPGHLGELCREGSEYAATLALRWAELHWSEAEEARVHAGWGYFAMAPQLPDFELLGFLQDGNAVPNETKQQISDFLSKNATRLYPHEDWLRSPPPGTEKWLISIADEALHLAKNSTRTLGAKLLRDAGVAGVKPELRPAPRYRLFLNEQLWIPRGSDPVIGVRVDSASGSSGYSDTPKVEADGTIAVDPDYFSQEAGVGRAYIYSPAHTGNQSNDTAEPWIHAGIPIPPKFGETTDIRIETVRLTIKPKLPRPLADYAGKTISVDFGSGDGSPPYLARSYSVRPNKPFVLEYVQPGDYWYRLQVPGTINTSWQRIQVTAKTTNFEPELENLASSRQLHAIPARSHDSRKKAHRRQVLAMLAILYPSRGSSGQ